MKKFLLLASLIVINPVHASSSEAITSDGQTAYVVNTADNTVTPIDVATQTPGYPIAVGPNPIGVEIVGDTVFVTHEGSDLVTPIDTATNTAGTPMTKPAAAPQAPEAPRVAQ